MSNGAARIDPHFMTLKTELLAQSLKHKVGPRTSGKSQPEDGQLLDVQKRPDSRYKPLYCWHNCGHYQKENGGRIVYGWRFFRYMDDMYVAQHHAIWTDEQHLYVDVTPEANPNNEPILFVADGRIFIEPLGAFKRPTLFIYFQSDDLLRWGLLPESAPPGGVYKPDYWENSGDIDEEVRRLQTLV